MQRISVNLTSDCDGNQLNYKNYSSAIENKNYLLQKPFGTEQNYLQQLFYREIR